MVHKEHEQVTILFIWVDEKHTIENNVICSYLASQSLDWVLIQENVVVTKLDIYVFIWSC